MDDLPGDRHSQHLVRLKDLRFGALRVRGHLRNGHVLALEF
jgi:hypothetical protein